MIFELQIYYPGCCLNEPDKDSMLNIVVENVKVLYIQEMAFRIIDYFLDKFIWAVTYTDPYDDEEELHKKKPIHNIYELAENLSP